ncbi:MAG: RDD family protein [Pseudomonadota bacterium]
MQAAPPPALSPLLRRALSLAYEALLLAALLWCAALLFRIIETPLAVAHSRTIFQAYLFLLTSAYFVWQWTHGGQTLAMKAWRIRLVTPRGDAINARQAWTRYLLATFSLGAFGLGFVWALIDRERQFLHDRLAGTRLVSCQRLAPLQTQHQDDRKPEE